MRRHLTLKDSTYTKIPKRARLHVRMHAQANLTQLAGTTSVFMDAIIPNLVYIQYAIFLDLLFTIGFSEYNRSLNLHRYRKRQRKLDSGDLRSSSSSCIASVIRYRDDPALYARCLRSYLDRTEVGFFVAGIDGDEEQDLGMVKTFREVCPTSLTILYIPSPYAAMAT